MTESMKFHCCYFGPQFERVWNKFCTLMTWLNLDLSWVPGRCPEASYQVHFICTFLIWTIGNVWANWICSPDITQGTAWPLLIFKCISGAYDLDINRYVKFCNSGSGQGHPTTRSATDPLLLKVPFCRTEAFKSSFFNRI